MASRARLLAWLGPAAALTSALASGTSCYSAGQGSPPPLSRLYFPVGLAVSEHGNVLYAVSSDFDLQWNGGTIQSFDLHRLRADAVRQIESPPQGCPNDPPPQRPDGSGLTQPLGWTCAPPVDSTPYVRDAVIIGAFATDLRLVSQRDTKGNAVKSRLFAPVRGDASLTWADVDVDPETPPPDDAAASADYPGFRIHCDPRTSDGRCDASHRAGTDPNEPGNTRNVTLPGEPFGMAVTADATSIVLTHQSDTKVSLLSSGLAAPSDDPNAQSPSGYPTPSLQFVLDGLPGGGVGIAEVPHDPRAYPSCAPSVTCAQAPRASFLEVSRASAQMSLLRYYDDQAPGVDGGSGPASSLLRPFLVDEANYVIPTNAGGADSRGIVIDPTPRIACEAGVDPAAPDHDAQILACARKPARYFVTNRSPASLLLGTIGDPGTAQDGSYSADAIHTPSNTPLPLGPSRLFLAPIVDKSGNYALRLFIVCYDASEILVFDPDTQVLEDVIRVGRGPFAIAFDPFTLTDAALRKPVPADTRSPDPTTRRYRFAYVASFTDSYLQVLDLDATNPQTFGTIVYRMGIPTAPKGS